MKKERIEELPLSEELVKEFIEKNKQIWPETRKTDKYILINFSMVRMQAAWIIPKLIYAKGLESSTGANSIVLTWRKNSLLTQLIESFGMKHIAIDELNRRDLGAACKSMFKVLLFLLIDGSGEGLKKLRAKNILVGTSIYEDILRTSSLSTIVNVKNKICIKKILHLLWTFYSLDSFCKKKDVQYVISDDVAYHENMFLRLFHSYGAVCYNSSSVSDGKLEFEEDGSIIRRSRIRNLVFHEDIKVLDEKIAIEWSKEYLKQRYLGINGRDIDKGAFLNKKVLTREELEKEYKLNNTKKNIVIMAHTFTDAVFNYGNIYFRDYYDWTEQTLKIASNNNSVNWILKPHPTRSAYNESIDSIENMYEKYKKDHIFFLQDDVSAESIKNIADVLITIGGNAGAEFACEGIPAIIVGYPYYRGFGYTIEPKSFDEYREVLNHVNEIKPLSDDQIKIAQKVFYLGNNKCNNDSMKSYTDTFSNLINEKYSKMNKEIALEYFASNKGTKEYNDEILKAIIDNIEEFPKCEYYQRGYNRGLNN